MAATPAAKVGKGLLIRDDGMLYPAVDAVARMPNFRPYHGDPMAPLEDRMRYLQGFTEKVSQSKIDQEMGTFNVNTATKEELMDFAENEFGHRLDGRSNLATMRETIKRLATEAEQAAARPAEQAA